MNQRMLSNNDAVIGGSLREMSDEWLVVGAQDGNINAFADSETVTSAHFCERHIGSPETGKMRRMHSRTPFLRLLPISIVLKVDPLFRHGSRGSQSISRS